MSNSQKFIDDFRAIESLLRRRYGSKMSFSSFLQILKRAEEHNVTVAHFANDLREYAELRNAILHNSSPSALEAIAEPHKIVVNRIANIRKYLEDPPKVSKYATRPVYIAKGSQQVVPTARYMLKKLYTHVPIYDDKSKFRGVLSETSLLRFVGSQLDKVLDSNALIEDMYQHLDKSGDKINDHIFLPDYFGILEARAKFEEATREGRRLGAILITRGGSAQKPITGIITAWDLPRLEIKI